MCLNPSYSLANTILGRKTLLTTPTKRKVFISYHHLYDQGYCNYFRGFFSKELEIFTDKSLNTPIRSNDHEYVNRIIREDYIVGSSLTIVLCGKETHKRKYVDWEIYSTLHHGHALLGIALPESNHRVPDRLYNNWKSGYAHYVNWDIQNWLVNHQLLINEIENAITKAQNKKLIDNSKIKMQRNLF